MSQRKIFNKIFDSLERVVTGKALTYQEIFEGLGISEMLNKMYIPEKALNKEYRDIIFNSIKKFINKEALFKGISLSDEKELKFLMENEAFKEFRDDELFQIIKQGLYVKADEVMEYLNTFPSGEEIAIKEVIKNTKIAETPLLFILNDLVDRKKVYSYNEREVTLN